MKKKINILLPGNWGESWMSINFETLQSSHPDDFTTMAPFAIFSRPFCGREVWSFRQNLLQMFHQKTFQKPKLNYIRCFFHLPEFKAFLGKNPLKLPNYLLFSGEIGHPKSWFTTRWRRTLNPRFVGMLDSFWLVRRCKRIDEFKTMYL